MWWSERTRRDATGRARRRSLVCLPLAIGLAAGLSGCQLRPLYAPSATNAGPQAALPAIDVDPPVTRLEQVFRNELLFGLRGGGAGAAARYQLVYRLTVREQGIAIERDSGTPNAYQLTGGVSFLLKDIASGASVFGASVSGADSYTRSSQNFANIRALRDAEDRLAAALATLAQARLSAYFATR